MIAGFLKILTPLMVIIPGIIGYHIYGDTISDADLTYSYLVRDLMPNYLLGFFAAVMFGAVLSSYNSVLNSAATLFSLNIYKPKFGKNKSDLEIVNKGKLFGFLVALISMFIAPMIMNAPNGLFQYLQTVNGFFSVPIFTIIFIGYTTKRVPAIAAKIALIIFVSSYAMLQLVVKPDLHFLHQLAILFVICCGIMLAIGKKYPRKEPFILKDKNVVELTPWDKQYEVATLIVTFMISFYLIFSKLGLVTQNYSNLKSYLMILWTVAIMIALFFRKRRLRKIELESIKIIQGEA